MQVTKAIKKKSRPEWQKVFYELIVNPPPPPPPQHPCMLIVLAEQFDTLLSMDE